MISDTATITEKQIALLRKNLSELTALDKSSFEDNVNLVLSHVRPSGAMRGFYLLNTKGMLVGENAQSIYRQVMANPHPFKVAQELLNEKKSPLTQSSVFSAKDDNDGSFDDDYEIVDKEPNIGWCSIS